MWADVLQELNGLGKGADLLDMSEVALDVLHGSMWSLNIRYKTLPEAMKERGRLIVSESKARMRDMLKFSPWSYKRRTPERCGIGFGTFGWKYDPNIVRRAIREGACLIDTAEGYGWGRVEEALGPAVQAPGYNHVPIATKVRRDHLGSRDAIFNALKRSNEKLGTVPHVQVHFPRNDRPCAPLWLSEAARAGLALSVGLGNCSMDMVEQTQLMLSTATGDPIRSVQVSYSLVDRRIERVLLPYCQDRGIVVLAYSPLGQKFKKILTPELREVAEKHDATPAMVALAWLLEVPGVLPIPRSNNPQHVAENMMATQLRLDFDDMELLDNVYPRRAM